jgi:HSP20 family protein
MVTSSFTRPLWDPFRDLERMLDEATQVMATARDGRFSTDYPPITVWSHTDGLIVTAEVPGADPAGIAVSVLDDTLTIRGASDDGRGFVREIHLPCRVDSDRTEARCKDGILTIVLKRPEAEKPRRIAVSAA